MYNDDDHHLFYNSLSLRERPQHEIYNDRIEENLKRYGAGMLKR